MDNIIAIILSVISLAFAGIALGWNIYRDVVLKPRMKVSLAISTLHSRGASDYTTHIDISATNFGPSAITAEMIEGRVVPWLLVRLFRKSKYFVVVNDQSNPLSARLPTKMEVGERINILFPHEADSFLKNGPTHIGLRDSFRRIHWAPKRDIARAITQFQKDFPDS